MTFQPNCITKEFDNMSLEEDDEYEFIIEEDDEYEFIIEEDDEEEGDEEEQGYKYCILSIDVGIVHLGISVSLVDEEFNLLEIIWVDNIDITKFSYNHDHNKCNLHHSKTFCDWMDHTFQDNYDFFKKADVILIEKQPPMGLVAIEQLIFSRWRDKTILISPNSVHKYFNIGGLDYDVRKICMEKLAKIKITDKNLLDQLEYYDRYHDIGDTIGMLCYWLNKKKKEYFEIKRRERIMERYKNGKMYVKTENMVEYFKFRN